MGVIPAKAKIHSFQIVKKAWIPFFKGMTTFCSDILWQLANLPVHIGEKEPQDAAHMHRRIPESPVTAAARIMYDSNVRADKSFVASQGQTGAKVDVLIVEKETLIKTTHCPKNWSRKQHEHASHPIGR